MISNGKCAIAKTKVVHEGAVRGEEDGKTTFPTSQLLSDR